MRLAERQCFLVNQWFSGSCVAKLERVFDTLGMAIKEVAVVDPDGLTDAELAAAVVELDHHRAALDATYARLVGAFDTRRVFAADGAQTAAAWMSRRTRSPQPECGGRVRVARKLAHMPLVADAWEAGEITVAHVRRLAGVRNPRTTELFARDESMLVNHARELTFSGFEQALDRWLLLADPDGCDKTAVERRERRRVSLDETLGGMYSGATLLDPVSGTIVWDELQRLEQGLFAADWKAAKTRLGRDPLPAELDRAGDQRRADALVEMARRSASMPPGAKAPKPLITLVVGAGRFFDMCQLESGRTVSPEAVRPWLRDAQLEGMLFDPAGLRAIKITRKRTFTGVVRRILDVRDQQCTDPYCEEPPNRCQGDHIIPYTAGGVTSQDNGKLACGHHNRRNYHNYRTPPPPNDDDSDDDDDD